MLKLPEQFVLRTQELLGDEYQTFEKALEMPPPVSVRVNDKIKDYKPSENKVTWCDSGYYLAERPAFTADPLFHAGVYYVQEASSMFLEQIIKQHFPEKAIVLDLCAAPGGKSTLISQNLGKNSLLVSNEINRSRAMILAENVLKWGNPNVIVTNNSPADFNQLPGFFDVIVVDAPCSGEGMFRKDPGAIIEWSEQNVQMCANRQKTILEDVWESLKTGGLLVYSTCTYNREENEENVAFFCENLGAEILKVNTSHFEGIVNTGFGYRFYPHKVAGEGFFITVLIKTAVTNAFTKIRIDTKKLFYNKSEEFRSRLKKPDAYEILEDDDKVVAYQKIHFMESLWLKIQLNCLENGILLANIKGSDIIPAHQLALSKELNRDSVQEIELDYENAISFLKRNNLFLPDAPKGHLLITYQHQPLGWVKNIGSRSNNLYPQHWRIRMNI